MDGHGAAERDRRQAHRRESFIRRPLADRSLMGYVLFRLRYPLVLMLGLTICSTIGFMVLEEYDFLTAFFFTVITLSTVGYGEARTLDHTGMIFATGVIVTSFAGLLYTATTLTNLFTSGDAITHLKQQKGRRMRDELSAHVIVVGFGRVGQAVARGVVELGHRCLVLEKSPQSAVAIEEAGCVAYTGDATDEHDLLEAGITRAIALVAATEEDATNLVVTLTARAVRPNLRIVSRVNEADWQDRIVRAGANVAQSPYPSYGLSLAATAVSSSSVGLHTLPALGLTVEEIEVDDGSKFVGLDVSAIGALLPNIVIMGVRRQASFQRWHEVDSPIEPGDVVVALGPPEGIRDLASYT